MLACPLAVVPKFAACPGAHILKLLGGCKLARDRILKSCVGTYVYTILEYNPGVESFILGLDLVPARQSKPQNSPFLCHVSDAA